MMGLLQDESELEEIVNLVGMDALSAPDRLKLEAARSIREDYLHQNAFHEIDTYSSMEKQFDLMKLIMIYYEEGLQALGRGAEFGKVSGLDVREEIGRFKNSEEKDVAAEFARISGVIRESMSSLAAGEAEEE